MQKKKKERNENYRLIYLMKIDIKFFLKTSNNQEYIENTLHREQIVSFQGCKCDKT
jgi:hypothetical protein